MHTLLIMFGLLITVIFFLIDKNLFPGSALARKRILMRLERNKEKDMELQAEFVALVHAYEAWSHKAFPQTDVTYTEYINLLKEKSSIEYSDAEFEKLKSRLERHQISDYIEKVKNQEEAVVALQADIASQKKKLQSLDIAKAS